MNDPQTKIARLNEEIAQMERDLEAKDNTLRGREEDGDAHNSHTGERLEGRDYGGAVERGGRETGNSEMANFWKERKKEQQEWKENFVKLEQHYDLLASASQSSGKGKIVLVDNLFQNSSSPFIEGITTYYLPDKFKVPDISVYSRLGDHIEHLENF
jgi:hypothetical protein